MPPTPSGSDDSKMTIYAIIPVKNLADSKRRLSPVFTPRQRQILTLAMLEDVLIALKKSYIDQIVLVGENGQVGEIASKYGVSYYRLAGAKLNAAIDKTSSFCIEKGASSILVLPADIPLVESNDINKIIKLGEGSTKAVVLSPSQNWGTNALYQNPPKLIPPCFGPASFLRHIREAYLTGTSVRLHFSPRIASDIDSVGDLRRLYEIGDDTVCLKVLKGIVADNIKAKELFNRKNKKRK